MCSTLHWSIFILSCIEYYEFAAHFLEWKCLHGFLWRQSCHDDSDQGKVTCTCVLSIYVLSLNPGDHQ